MIKRSLLISLLVSVSVLLSSCGWPFESPNEWEDRYETIKNVDQAAVSKFEEFYQSYDNNKAKALAKTAEKLKKRDVIKNAGVSNTGNSIWYEYQNGIRGGLLVYDYKLGEEMTTYSKTSSHGSLQALKSAKYQSTPIDKEAILLAPFRSVWDELFGYITGWDWPDHVRNKLSSFGYAPHYYEDEKVSVELLRTLDRYGVTVMITHGTTTKFDGTKTVVVATGLEVTPQRLKKYEDELTPPSPGKETELIYDDICLFKLGKCIWTGRYFFITPLFVRNNAGSYPRSVVYIGGCESYWNGTLARAFSGSGASVFIGWEKDVQLGTLFPSTQSLFTNLTDNRMSVQEAIEAIDEPYLNYHPLSGGNVILKPWGENLILNPDFEDKLDHWEVSSGTAEYSPSEIYHSGMYGVLGKEISRGSLGRLYQDVTTTLTVGAKYKISGWIKTANVDGHVVIGLDYVKSDGWTPADGYVEEIGHVSGTTDWTYYESDPFTLPPMPEDTSALWFLLDFNAGTGKAWWDDLSLVEVGQVPQ